jgi:GDP-D-mannose 3', 5'-epimerase
MLCVVAGAGGFIGGHLVKNLLDQGHEVRAVDIKPIDSWCQRSDKTITFREKDILIDWNRQCTVYDNFDLRLRGECQFVTDGADRVYNLAADMGGMGFIETHKADCMLSSLINTHLLLASVENHVDRFFYASSACVYAADKQTDVNNPGLKESDAYPAQAEDGYGWEKLFSERMCRHFLEDYGLTTRVARFHNVYGPYGTYDGGREKAPAAICRKVIKAKQSKQNYIDVWGDGQQTRSFMYVDDCIRGINSIMDGPYSEPVNLGSSEMVSINHLVDIVSSIAGAFAPLAKHYDLAAPKGVRGRSSNNEIFRQKYGWEPSISLHDGLTKTYSWIEHRIQNEKADRPEAEERL